MKVGANVCRNSLAFEDDQATDRPSRNVQHCRWNLLVSRAFVFLILAFKPQSYSTLRMGNYDINSAFGSPNSPPDLNFSSNLKAEMFSQLNDSLA